MSQPDLRAPRTIDGAATSDAGAVDDSAVDDSPLAQAVAGIGGIVPAAPLDLLAPRLRTPLFALFVVLAVSTHAAGLGAHLWMRWAEGADGQNAKATGVNVIEVDIVDGTEVDAKGGRPDEAVPGDPNPAAPVAIEQAATAPSLAAEALPPPPTTEPTLEDSPAPPLAPSESALTTDAPAESVVAAVPPDAVPANELPRPRQDTPEPQKPEPIEQEPVAADAVRRDEPTATTGDAQPERAASQASIGGEDGSSQAPRQIDDAAGRAGATPGEIKTYHSRLGARLRAYKPSGFGRKGHVVVAFALDADGALRFAEIRKSTGNAYLESKALTAVRKAAPFPKPPVRMSGKQLEFSVPFTFE